MPLWNPAYVGSIWLRKKRLFANQNVILFFENKMKVTGCVEAAVTQKCLQIEKVLPVQVGKSSFINHLRTELYYGHLPNVIQANANCILCRETCVNCKRTFMKSVVFLNELRCCIKTWTYQCGRKQSVASWNGTHSAIAYGYYDLVTAMLFTLNLGGEISTEFICYGLLVNEGIGATLWGLWIWTFRHAEQKEVEGLLPPSATAVTLSEDTRHAQPGPSRQVRRQKLYAFRPMHQDDTSHHATTRMATRRDQTTGVPSTALSVPAVGAGCVVTLDTQSRGHLSGVSLWRLERCHCWSPAWPLSWLLGVVVKADHHCCEAKVQLRDAAYHMLWDEENAAAVACGSSNLWVCLLLVSLNGTHIEPVLDWRERVEACWTLPSRGAWA